MERKYSKDYFKKTSISMGLLYAVMGCILAYCLCVMFLPNVAFWIFVGIKSTLKYLSFGNDDLYMFNCGFFFSCLGGLILAGIVLNIVDYVKYKKEQKNELNNENLDM